MIKSFRLRYFVGHLVISTIVALFSWYLVFSLWYPSPFDEALGVGGIILMMLVIDVILGPLLTLILAKEGKKGLKKDLTIVGLVQIIALLYGLYNIDKGRPIALAFDINRFEPVLKYTILNKDGKKIIQEYAKKQGTAIPSVAIRPAKNEEELAKRMNDELTLGILPSSNPDLYQDIGLSNDIIKTQMKPIVDLVKFNDKNLVEPIVQKYPRADGFLPMVGSAKTLAVLVDTKNQQVVTVVNLRPW